MERLTKDFTKASYSPWEVCGMDYDCKKSCFDKETNVMDCNVAKAMCKLSEYENIGLTPEQIEELKIENKVLRNAGKILKMNLTAKKAEELLLEENKKSSIRIYEPQLAKWVDGVCSNCKAYLATDHIRDYISEEENKYCYSCGSKMEM